MRIKAFFHFPSISISNPQSTQLIRNIFHPKNSDAQPIYIVKENRVGREASNGA